MDFGAVVFVVVRFIHIVCAVGWVSIAIFVTFIARPAMNTAGAEAGKLSNWLFGKGQIGTVMSAASGLTILSGIYLYLNNSNLFRNADWLASPAGIIFSIGAVLGMIGGAIGGRQLTRFLKELAATSDNLVNPGVNPSAELLAKFRVQQSQMFKAMRTTTYLVLLALACMALAGSLPA